MSGKFPKSENVDEFLENLCNKVDMTSPISTRWPTFNSELPERSGFLEEYEAFDIGFFGK